LNKELVVNIGKSFQEFHLNINLKTNDKVVGIIGPSGAGKSLLLNCIAGLQKPDSGEIYARGINFYHNKESVNLTPGKRNIGYVFQNYALFPNMTVRENIILAIEHLDKTEIEKRFIDKVKLLNLEGQVNKYPKELSGGQQQRVAIARALVIEPNILLLDEPLAAIDEFSKRKIIHELKNIITNFSGIVIIVTHNLEEAYELSDRLIMLSDGNVLINKPKAQVFSHPESKKVADFIGIENIYKIKSKDKNKVVINESGIEFQIEGDVDKEASHVCFRSSDIRVNNNEDSNNKYEVKVNETLETIDGYNVILDILNPKANKKYERVIWKVKKQVWDKQIKEGKNFKICIPPNQILTLKD
jgi:molybdate transport system ATP-binding protein